ncbi:hypothetical protein DPMN_011280 [Dreissena polymorpha]|uniref:Uncharacterized protein n=1 Tax=Dreissena polymorpha TaxID=45954 RepID=A0A9D4RZU9_DREPO|nr:hypothetical protein DPMN_011280 [Dreissena polymorpha]
MFFKKPKNLRTKFYEDRTINVTFKVLTRKTAPSPGGHVFQRTGTIFKLSRDIMRSHVLTKVLTRKTTPPLCGHIFQRTGTICKLNRAIIENNNMTKLHEDWTINVTSRVLTSKTAPPPWRPYSFRTNVLTKFYYSHIGKTVPPPGVHVFQLTGTIFELSSDSIGTNVLTKFHEDLTIHVTPRIFELDQDIIGTNLLTKFHEDQTINVAARVLTRQNVDDGRRTTDKR